MICVVSIFSLCAWALVLQPLLIFIFLTKNCLCSKVDSNQSSCPHGFSNNLNFDFSILDYYRIGYKKFSFYQISVSVNTLFCSLYFKKKFLWVSITQIVESDNSTISYKF